MTDDSMTKLALWHLALSINVGTWLIGTRHYLLGSRALISVIRKIASWHSLMLLDGANR